MTTAQRRVLEHIKSRRPHLSYGGDNHWFFNGEYFKIHANTGFALVDAGLIVKLPRLKDQPFWREDYALTPDGRAALERGR